MWHPRLSPTLSPLRTRDWRDKAMEGGWMIEPGVGWTDGSDDRSRPSGQGVSSWPLLLTHVIGMTTVLSLTVVALIVTGWLTEGFLEGIQDLTNFLQTLIIEDFVHDLFTDENGAPLLVALFAA
jgi:hypothetical protein